MTGHTRDVGSSSTSTGISPHLTSSRSPASSGAPRKRTWGGGLQQEDSRSSQTGSYNNSGSGIPDLLLEASLGRLSLNNTPHAINDSDCEQLQSYVQKLKYIIGSNIPADSAYKEYSAIKDKAKALCKALLQPSRSSHASSCPSPRLPPSSLSDVGLSLASELSDLSLGTKAPSGTNAPGDWLRSPHVYNQRLDLVRTWTNYLGDILIKLKTSIATSYKNLEVAASPGMVEQLFRDKAFRTNTILRMRMASVADTKVVNVLDRHLREFDTFSADLSEMRNLLHDAESGISPGRTVEDIIISQRGDVVLEFANKDSDEFPVLRFRVSSHMLAETSPLFAHMFGEAEAQPPTQGLDGPLALYWPSISEYTCADGAEVKLLRMPQLELNIGKSLEILLHAAHLHNDKVPRDIEFDTFVAVAEACMRYQCTAPLELTVEYVWLPMWIHKATENIADGLLLISYAFGLRGLFSRMSKTAVLKIVDHDDIQSRPFPPRVKDKIWAMRTAKIDQVHHCCRTLMQEYLRREPSGDTLRLPSGKSRCSKGSHACDALSLGWLMMAFSETEILPQIMHTTERPPLPKRSLEQLINSLRFLNSPPDSHPGPCDFASTFRAAINDIFNSIRGVTLFDVTGKHGWALSKHRAVQSQSTVNSERPQPDHKAMERDRGEVAFRVLSQLDDIEDVYNAALASKSFFRAFKDNEPAILRGLIAKCGQPRRWTIGGAETKEEARAELKMLRDNTRSMQVRHEGTAVVENADGLQSSDTYSQTTEYTSQLSPTLDGNDPDSLGIADDPAASPSSLDGKMTREEAERILWPEADTIEPFEAGGRFKPFSQSTDIEDASGEEMRASTEKFLAGEITFYDLEHKSLVEKEEKNLSGEHYQRIGLVRTNFSMRADECSELI
ncbi:hypothetical protein KJ359_000621 [Pestalotiopsis sp. 9143b]|nr:hypothetical protein KJ359_000621 [Pestalotiopsis sp. 9143b]